MNYLILAAGQGSRFKKAGYTVPKPLVELNGEPMIGRLVRLFARHEAETIRVVVNAEMQSVLDYLYKLQAEGLPLDIVPMISDNSFKTLDRGAQGFKGKFIGTTVDAIFDEDELQMFVDALKATPEGHVLMGLTRYCDDPSPLYARIGPDGRVCDYRYGGEPFEGDIIVSAGIYGITDESLLRAKEVTALPESLSDFQRILAAETDVDVDVFEFYHAMDVDNPDDQKSAEEFLSEKATRQRRLNRIYKSTLKSSDTEEHIDLWFYRKLGFAWACLFEKLGVSPNAVTIASIFLGVGAGLCFYPPVLWINIIGLLLLVWANTYDSADGQLARMTGKFSPIGRILDGVAGDCWFITIYICILLRTINTVDYWHTHADLMWIIAACAGFSHIVQAAVADYYRQFHLLIVKGGFNTELETSERVEGRLKALSWSRQPFAKLLMTFYALYTKLQENMSTSMRAVMTAIRRRYPDGLPHELGERLRALSLPLCKWENFLTFNWRSIMLAIAILAGHPWWYFAGELTLFNLVLLYLLFAHRRACRRMKALIDG